MIWVENRRSGKAVIKISDARIFFSMKLAIIFHSSFIDIENVKCLDQPRT